MNSMLKTLLIATLTLLLFAPQAPAAENHFDSRTTAQLDRVLRQQMAIQQLSGLAVGLVVDGKLQYLQGFGFADIDRLDPITETSRFRWASLSKPLTATLAIKAASSGQVGLDQPIDHYLLDLHPENGRVVTLRQLLSHQAGIGHYPDLPDWPRHIADYTASPGYTQGYSAIAAARALDLGQHLLFIPGSQFHYSSFGYLLAGAVLEAASGLSFEELARQNVSQALQLNSLEADRAWLPGKVQGYQQLSGQLVPSAADDVRWKLPGGGFVSNIRDATRWMQAVMAGPYLTEIQRRQLWREQQTSLGQATGYGLGFALAGQGRERRISHAGGQSQTRTLMAFYPERQWGVMLMSNAEWADLDRIETALEAVLIQRPD